MTVWADKEAKSLGVGKICYFDSFLNNYQQWEAFVLLYEMFFWGQFFKIRILVQNSIQIEKIMYNMNLIMYMCNIHKKICFYISFLYHYFNNPRNFPDAFSGNYFIDSTILATHHSNNENVTLLSLDVC